MEFSVNQIFIKTYPPEAANWCNESGKYFIEEQEKNENGERVFMIKETPEPPPPTKEDIEKMRASEYASIVDPITCTILRKRDILSSTLSGDDYLVLQTEIDELVALRAAKVQEIKDRYPYPEE